MFYNTVIFITLYKLIKVRFLINFLQKKTNNFAYKCLEHFSLYENYKILFKDNIILYNII
jgi:hypothetical protein